LSKIAAVPAVENSTQGGFLRGFYSYYFPAKKARKITGFKFLVVPVPALPGMRPDTRPKF
jgi:hypothetical protein